MASSWAPIAPMRAFQTEQINDGGFAHVTESFNYAVPALLAMFSRITLALAPLGCKPANARCRSSGKCASPTSSTPIATAMVMRPAETADAIEAGASSRSPPAPYRECGHAALRARITSAMVSWAGGRYRPAWCRMRSTSRPVCSGLASVGHAYGQLRALRCLVHDWLQKAAQR